MGMIMSLGMAKSSANGCILALPSDVDNASHVRTKRRAKFGGQDSFADALRPKKTPREPETPEIQMISTPMARIGDIYVSLSVTLGRYSLEDTCLRGTLGTPSLATIKGCRVLPILSFFFSSPPRYPNKFNNTLPKPQANLLAKKT